MPPSLAAVLVIGVVTPLWAQGTASSTNVALGKKFTCSSPGGIAWRGLLDGDKTSDNPPGCFATGPDKSYPKKVVIDLGAVYLIDQVIVYSSKNGNTKKVDLWASRDGVNYTQLRDSYVFPRGIAQRMSARFPPLEARYVKLAFWDTYGGGLGGDHILYLREVEVMGRPAPSTAQTRTRPEVSGKQPRLVRVFARYVLQKGSDVRLLVIGDDMAVGVQGGQGLGQVVAEKLRARFSLASVEVNDTSRRGLKARSAAVYPLPAGADSDITIVALGMADSLAFDPVAFRLAMEQLLRKLLDRTSGLVIVVVPPRIPHSASLGRAEECRSANTADPAWQIASLASEMQVAIVDADAAIQESGLAITNAYADNLSLSDAGHEAIASAIISLFP